MLTTPSWPGLSRPSTIFGPHGKEGVDARDKPGHDDLRKMSALHLRPYVDADEAATIDLWHRTWQQAYPQIDFAARLDWWRERWRNDLVPKASIVVSEQDGAVTGFVTIDGDGYLDQLVVDPSHWGSDAARLLVDEAKRLSPSGITLLVNKDNSRAIRFYERNGFAHEGSDVNPTSGRAVLKMAWRP